MTWRYAACLTGYLVLLVTASVAAAQQGAKDRKDYLLEALESQRNDSLAKAALCYADANGQIADLTAKLNAANAALAAAKAPAPAQ